MGRTKKVKGGIKRTPREMYAITSARKAESSVKAKHKTQYQKTKRIQERKAEVGKLNARVRPEHKARAADTRLNVNAFFRDAIVHAAATLGEDGKGFEGVFGYMRMIARTEPRIFAMLIAKVMPLQIQSTHRTEYVVRHRHELLLELKQRGLPVKSIFEVSDDEYDIIDGKEVGPRPDASPTVAMATECEQQEAQPSEDAQTAFEDDDGNGETNDAVDAYLQLQDEFESES